MKENKNMFQIYSDESGFPAERFQSLALISGKKEDMENLRDILDKILQKNNLKEELKWSQLSNYKPKILTVLNFIDASIAFAVQKKIRIDVLYWDLTDSRHNITGRDNIANLERMYYKIIRHVINTWSTKTAEWELFPDENSSLNWKEIELFLKNTKLGKKQEKKSFSFFLFSKEDQDIFFQISKIEQKESKEEVLIQLADLFAGIARFSKEWGEEYINWINSENYKNQLRLFEEEDFDKENTESKNNISKKTIIRFSILKKLDSLCKKNNLQVSLKTNKYLVTMKPTNPVNFWFYVPQHEKDKAPTKEVR